MLLLKANAEKKVACFHILCPFDNEVRSRNLVLMHLLSVESIDKIGAPTEFYPTEQEYAVKCDSSRSAMYLWIFLALDDLAVPRVLHVVLGLREDELAGRRL